MPSTAKKKSGPTWVRFHGDGILCFRCGVAEKMFPLSLDKKRLKAGMLNLEAFQEEHARCVETESSPSRHVPKTPREWLDGYDTGISSKAICRTLLGLPVEDPTPPRDPADFGRCYRLLKLFPDWRARLAEVAKAFPASAWPALVACWDELTQLYELELPTGSAPKLWARMQQLSEDRTADQP